MRLAVRRARPRPYAAGCIDGATGLRDPAWLRRNTSPSKRFRRARSGSQPALQAFAELHKIVPAGTGWKGRKKVAGLARRPPQTFVLDHGKSGCVSKNSEKECQRESAF